MSATAAGAWRCILLESCLPVLRSLVTSPPSPYSTLPSLHPTPRPPAPPPPPPEPSKGGKKVQDPSKSLAADTSAIPTANEFEKNANFGIVTAWWVPAQTWLACPAAFECCRWRLLTWLSWQRRGACEVPATCTPTRCTPLLTSHTMPCLPARPPACVPPQAPRQAARHDVHPVLAAGAGAQGGQGKWAGRRCWGLCGRAPRVRWVGVSGLDGEAALLGSRCGSLRGSRSRMRCPTPSS